MPERWTEPIGHAVATSGFRVVEFRHRPNAKLAEHYHAFATASVVLCGEYREVSGEREHRCAPFGVRLKPPGLVHANYIGARGAHALLCEIAPARWAMIKDIVRGLEDTAVAPTPSLRFLAQRIHDELVNADPLSPLTLEGLVLELLTSTLRARGEPTRVAPLWLRRAKALIQDSRSERPSLDEIAREVGVHPVSLAQAFRRWFGCTVGDFSRSERLERAANTLTTTTLPVRAVGQEAGFPDHSHFSRVFRRRYGLSPGQYRRGFRS